MKREALFVGLALSAAFACRTAAPSVEVETVPSSPIFLWKAEKPGVPGKAYLLGSVHLQQPNTPLDDAVWTALDASDLVLAELSPEEKAGAAQSASLVLKYGTLPEGQTLPQTISAETFELLQKRSKEMQVPVLMFMRMKPWVVALTLISAKLTKDGYDPNAGVDALVVDAATREGLRAEGMETVEQQLRLFADLPPKLQEDLLRDALMGLDPARDGESDELFAAYRKGDAAKVAFLTFSTRLTHPNMEQLYRRMFDDRNLAMTSSITGYLQRPQTVFVVAGVGHMLGDRGIPQLMAERGFTVEPIGRSGTRSNPASAPASVPAGRTEAE